MKTAVTMDGVLSLLCGFQSFTHYYTLIEYNCTVVLISSCLHPQPGDLSSSINIQVSLIAAVPDGQLWASLVELGMKFVPAASRPEASIYRSPGKRQPVLILFPNVNS